MATLKVVFKAIDEISSKFNEMTQSGERALEAFENTGTAADGALSKVSRTAAQTAKSTDAAADSVDDLSSAIGDYEKATGQAANSTGILSEKTTETEKNLDEAAEAARKASEEVEKFGDKSEETGKQSEESSKKGRDGIKELQGVLASAGIAATLNEIKNGFFDCSEAAAQFETSTAMVATIADTSQKSLSSISKEVRTYSNETGEAASDMAEATYQAISASINTADAAAFAGTATKLAVGGFTSATTAVDVLTTAINAYGLAASDATQLSDYLITTQNLGKTSVDQLAQSVGKVIPLASAYNVQMDNLSSAYAVLTANGIATAESGTYLKSMLNELGDTGSGVSEVLLSSTGKTFAQLMEQGYSLGDVMAMLGNAVDGDSTAFNALWNSTEAGIGALSLFNAGADKYNSVLESMRTSAGATEKAYSTMADTTDKSKQRMENAFNNLKISVGDVLNPALTQVYEGFTGVFAGMSDFVDEHPAVVAAISAIAVGVGGFTGALAAYNLATTAAKFVTEAFTATLAANPYVLAAAGIVAVTAAAVTLTGVLITQSDEYEGMTATCRDQYDELQNLNDQYNAACEQYGENSDAANSLRYQLDQLNDEFEANRQTVKEFVAECDGLVESHNKVMDTYNSSTSSIKDQELGTLALTQRLGELASQNTQTTASYTEMKAIIDQLNADVPGLGLTYDGVTESVDATVEAIKKAAKAQADSEYKAEQQQTYVDLLKEQSSLEQQIAEAEANLDAERQRRGMRQDDVTGDWVSGSGFWMEDSPWVAWTSDIDEYKKSLEELQSAYDENQQTLSDIEGEWRGVAQAVEDAQNQTVTYDEAVSMATSSAQSALDELTAAYDKAYQSARESIEGQIGLFDTMKTSSELSVSDMEKAMQSQTDYLNLYSENLKKAAEYGLDDGLIKSLSDGSEESAGYINAIIQNIEKLGGSTEGMPAAASKFVDEFNSKFEETTKAKDAFADSVAKMETDFDEKMGDIEQTMVGTVEKMEMTDEAAAAAKATIEAYCNALRILWLLPIIAIQIASIAVCYVAQYHAADDYFPDYMVGLMAVLLLINILIVFYVEALRENELEKFKVKFNEQQYNLQMEYYQQLKERQEEVRSLQHDVKKYILAMQAVAEHGDTEELHKIAQAATNVFERSTNISAVGNPVVDALLNYYLRIAERNNIKVKLDVTIPEVLTISSLSLSIIIGNTFDNAIEACCDLPAEQRIIHLQLRKQYRSLFYRLENPYSDTVRSIRIGEYHGYGLKNINRIVQENHGDFYTKKKDGVFTVQVRLNCEN